MSTMLSDVAELSNFKNHEMPFPMWQAALSTPDDIEFFGLKVPYYNATLFEFSPFEFGAWQGVFTLPDEISRNEDERRTACRSMHRWIRSRQLCARRMCGRR